MAEKRIGWLDLWRSIAIVLMLAYHFIFDLAATGKITVDTLELPVMTVIQLFTSCVFILLAGICCSFSRSNLRRGAVVFGAGLIVVAASVIVGFPIYFGILQLLGLCMILYGLLGKYFERLPIWLAAAAYAVLFVVSYPCAHGIEVPVSWLWMFGFVPPEFFSGDYYPIFPWIFMFLFGTCFGRVLKNVPPESRLYAPVSPVLTWPGRHSLIIYLLHQPILYGLCLLIK